MQVLFIEDDPMNRRVVKDMLTIVGISMAEAEGAEIGIRMIGETRYDVILMDLRMPGMDGLTAIRLIRARTGAGARIPIIVITADTAIDLREVCLAAGADQVLAKPVAMNALFDAIGDALASEDHVIL